MAHPDEHTSVNYKALTYWFAAAFVGLIVYVFTNTVAAQNRIDERQDNEIVGLEETARKLSEVNIRLGAIVERHEKEINTLSK
jgi:hypothetical protein